MRKGCCFEFLFKIGESQTTKQNHKAQNQEGNGNRYTCFKVIGHAAGSLLEIIFDAHHSVGNLFMQVSELLWTRC